MDSYLYSEIPFEAQAHFMDDLGQPSSLRLTHEATLQCPHDDYTMLP